MGLPDAYEFWREATRPCVTVACYFFGFFGLPVDSDTVVRGCLRAYSSVTYNPVTALRCFFDLDKEVSFLLSLGTGWRPLFSADRQLFALTISVGVYCEGARIRVAVRLAPSGSKT